jgi:polyisoprenoid-binding protein YceI
MKHIVAQVVDSATKSATVSARQLLTQQLIKQPRHNRHNQEQNMSTIEQAVRIETGTYVIDPVHTQVGFEVKHLGISTFRGSFGGFEGTITVGEEGIAAIEGSIDVSSVSVPEEQLIGHLLSAVNKVDGENYEVSGDLTLRGVTNQVALKVAVEGAGIGMDGSSVLSLNADGELNRNDYGISWGATLDNGAAVVAEKVRLVLTVEAVKAGE